MKKYKLYIPIITLIIILTTFLLNEFIFNDLTFEEGSPGLSAAHFIRTGLIAISSFLFITLLNSFFSRIKSFEEGNENYSEPLSSNQKTIVALIFIFSIVFVSLFLFDPIIFSAICRENKIIENLSALFALAGSIIFAITVSMIRKSSLESKTCCKLYSFSFAAVLFLLGMEEISWFQHFFKIKTPELFQGNVQNEMNLHNFATGAVENAYYFSAFVFGIALPYLKDNIPQLKNYKFLDIFIPGRAILLIGSVLVCYNYDMWNFLHIQLGFFITFFILISYFIKSFKNKSESLIFSFTLLLFFSTQLIFLINGDQLIRIWDVTEYKEFFIPLMFLVYSIEVTSKLKKSLSTSAQTKNKYPAAIKFFANKLTVRS